MKNDFSLVKGYQHDDALRGSFDALSRQVFGLSFEDWYQMGYWKDNYIPYSFFDGEKVAASVAVSPVNLMHQGSPLKLFQLGAVMTDPACRLQGLSRRLIEAVHQDFADADGSFLFANDSVKGFYPRFGYEISHEFECVLPRQEGSSFSARKVSLDEPSQLRRFEDAVRNSAMQEDPWMGDSFGHVMFYARKFYSSNIWYLEEQRAYAVARLAQGELFLYGIFAPQTIDPAAAAAEFGEGVERTVMGFSPAGAQTCALRQVSEEDSNFFIRGKALKFLEQEHVRLPVLIRT